MNDHTFLLLAEQRAAELRKEAAAWIPRQQRQGHRRPVHLEAKVVNLVTKWIARARHRPTRKETA